MTQPIYIYALAHPNTSEIRYVGKSIAPSKRLRGHIGAARRGEYSHHTSRWVRKLLDAGLEPTLVVLAEVGQNQDWRELERKFISDFERVGMRLTNSTAGGEGLDYRDPEDKARYAAKISAVMKARAQTPEGRASLQPMLERAHAPETVEKRRVSQKAYYQNPENRERCAETNREILSRPEVKAKKSKASKAMWRDPEVRAKLLGAFSRPDVKEKQSESKKKAWSDPELGKNLRAAANSPERRAKSSESAVARSTPEYRERFSGLTSAGWADPTIRAARQAGMEALRADAERNAARKEKMSAKSVAAWSDPEAKARRLEKMRDPEVVARKSAGLIAYHARRKAEKLAQANQA